MEASEELLAAIIAAIDDSSCYDALLNAALLFRALLEWVGCFHSFPRLVSLPQVIHLLLCGIFYIPGPLSPFLTMSHVITQH